MKEPRKIKIYVEIDTGAGPQGLGIEFEIKEGFTGREFKRSLRSFCVDDALPAMFEQGVAAISAWQKDPGPS